MSTCPTCQAPLADDSSFCARCGVRLIEASQATTATSLPQAAPRTPVATAATPTSSFPGSGRFVPGEMVGGRYRVVGLLGTGGMGEVYRADDLKLGQPVALKFLPIALEQNPDRLHRFLNEVRTARQISHPNVCRVYDIGEADGQHFLSMEYVDGEDLSTLLRRIGYIPTDKVIQIARQLCAGLAAAHAQGFLHRDLKPANIMLDGIGRVRITDFGLSGLAESFRGAEIRAGTPAYMSPEQISGESISVRSDLYSLGLVLYEMCTGHRAFDADSVAELSRLQLESTPVTPTSLVNSIDPTVERVILKCLEKDPARRPSSALEVSASLPGGDPLAAALAAGETPSPEMVAAAGGVGALKGWVAGALTLAGALGVIALALLPGTFNLTRRVDLPSPPEVMRARSREIARDLGWTDPPGDTVARYGRSTDWIEAVRRKDSGPDRWDAIGSVRPSSIRFWYRASPEKLLPANAGSNVTPTDPPETTGGMVRVMLDPGGRLLTFVGVTDDEVLDDTTAPDAEPDWAIAFDAAGLDLANAETIPPARVPRTGAAIRRAWRAAWGDRPEERVRVEAAAFGGRVTHFEVVAPWDEETWNTEPGPDAARGSKIEQAGSLALLALILGGGMLLARHNIRLGRGDRRGATRLALALGAVHMLWWALTADHVASIGGLGMVVDGAAYATLFGAGSWMVYLALEPYVRKIWPDSVISWSRLLDGRLRDPLVGRDVLLGSVAGILLALVLAGLDWAGVWLGQPPAAPSFSGFIALRGAPAVLGVAAFQGVNALGGVIAILFVAVLFSMLLRNRWIAVGVLWLLLTGLQTISMMVDRGPVTAALVSGALWGAIMLMLLRRGIVATAALLWTANLLLGFSIAIDLGDWFGPTQLIGPTLVGFLIVWGAVTSVAGGSLFQDPLVHAPRPSSRTSA